tara:strand:- start:11848 stop:12087 length:240 start_codon:yes stop_codon:yes gene_type:complete
MVLRYSPTKGEIREVLGGLEEAMSLREVREEIGRRQGINSKRVVANLVYKHLNSLCGQRIVGRVEDDSESVHPYKYYLL